jgi:response regulator RpfG family c-di-GMP phosphodiesterase
MIDDEEVYHRSFALVCDAMGAKAISFYEGDEALAYLAVNPQGVDIILLDLMIGSTYGLNILRSIKNNPALKHIDVIVQSGNSDVQEVQATYDAGAVSYITKPYNISLIITQIKTLIDTRRVFF